MAILSFCGALISPAGLKTDPNHCKMCSEGFIFFLLTLKLRPDEDTYFPTVEQILKWLQSFGQYEQ